MIKLNRQGIVLNAVMLASLLAVAAVPASKPRFAYVSSGTWSLAIRKVLPPPTARQPFAGASATVETLYSGHFDRSSAELESSVAGPFEKRGRG